MARSITVALELDDSRFNRGLNNAKTGVRGLEGGIGNLAGRLAGLATAAAGAFTFQGIVETTARFQDLQTTLNTVTGSIQGGAEAFDFIKTFATQTQFGVEELTQSYIKLKSNGIEPTRELLTTFTDAAAVTTDQLGSLQAITDLFSRTTSGGLGLEELNRLADRGIPVFSMLEEQLGLTRLEISEYGKTAEGAATITDALRLAINQEFGGATQDRLENLSTSMSNMGIAATNAMNVVGEGLAPAFQGIVTDITEFITQNDQLLRSLGELIGQGLSLLVENLDLVIAGVAGFAAAWTAIKFGELISLISGVGKAMLTLNAVIAANPIGAVATAIGLLVAGFTALVIETGSVENAFKTLGNTAIDVVNMIFNSFSALGSGIREIFSGLGSLIWDAMTGQLDGDQLGQRFSEILQQASASAQEQFTSQGPITYRFELEAVGGEEALDIQAKMAEAQVNIDEAAQENAQKAIERQLEQQQLQIKVAEEKTKIHEKKMEELAKEEEAEAEKDARREERHAREQTRAEAVLANAAAKLNADLTDISTINERIGLSDVEIEQLTTTNDLNREREMKLAEIARYNISDEEKNRLQDELNSLYDTQIGLISNAIEAADEQQRRFTTGWQNAMTSYVRESTNAAEIAESTFGTLTSGLEDAFIQFAETGKFSFKGLIDGMIREITKFIAKAAVRTFLNILTGGTGGSILGIFGFDSGGYIPAGKSGIVGEKGPEIVQGPAMVTGRTTTAALMKQNANDMRGGGSGGVVNYFISAVDTDSFRRLVAQDPEFIYNVTRAGSRGLPV